MRYFIFYYTYFSGSQRLYGFRIVLSKEFPNYSKIVDRIRSKSNISNPVITGFNEFASKEDFENFAKKGGLDGYF